MFLRWQKYCTQPGPFDGDVRLLTAFGEDYRARKLKEGWFAGIDIDASRRKWHENELRLVP